MKSRINISFNKGVAIMMGISFILLVHSSCRRSEVTTPVAIDQIVFRLKAEPENLSPVFSSSSSAREIHEYIYLSLCDHDPASLSLSPVLTKELPTKRVEEGLEIYDFELLQNAKWSDNKDITADDVVFTFKLVAHPAVNAGAWETILEDIVRIDVSTSNKKKFSIVTKGQYFLNAEAIMTAEILPEHILDPEKVLAKYTYPDLIDKAFVEKVIASDSAFMRVGHEFSSVRLTRDQIVGSGPYQLGAWESGQYILLDRVENYWGQEYPDRMLLHNNPKKLIFQFINENNAAMVQLRNKQIGFMDMSSQPYVQFEDLKQDSIMMREFHFERQATMRYYYLFLNTESPKLSDKRVRRALAHCMDVDRLISQIEGGYAMRSNTMIHPSQKAYNNTLKPINYDLAKAASLLDAAGWRDTDKDGIRDQMINGKKLDLSLRFFITGSALGEGISTSLLQSALQVGIKIEPIIKPNAQTNVENYNTGDYEIGTRAATPDLAPYDPFVFWHSTSVGQGGLNQSFFNNKEADQMIETIRMAKDENDRSKAYLRLQEIIYEEQPAIFLYSPQNRYVVDKDLKPLLSLKRPGYFANAFTRNQ